MQRNTSKLKSSKGPKVLAIGIDSPTHDLLSTWIEKGTLPNLQKCKQRSASSTLLHEKKYSNEHSWIPVLTGKRQESWDYWLDRWDASSYTYLDDSLYNWQKAPVFYALGNRRKVVSFDLSAPVVPGVNGVQVSGWATDLNECFPESNPKQLLTELVRMYGPDPKVDGANDILNRLSNKTGISYVIPNAYDPVALTRFADLLMRSAETRGRICLDLMGRDDWDLFITLFSEIHTGGHVLWHLSQPHPLTEPRRTGQDSLFSVYQAVDSSIAKLVEAAGNDTYIVIFTVDSLVADSLENARSLFLPEFLYRWSFPGKAALADGGEYDTLPQMRRNYRQHWKYEIWEQRTRWGEMDLESPMVQEARKDPLSWCPCNWYAPLWPQMKAFALPSFADGYVRLNVKGREVRGKIAASEFQKVCDLLEQNLAELIDERTGWPMVKEIVRVREDPFDDDPKKPPADLIVVWGNEHPTDVVRCGNYGRIGPVPYFRSGGHQFQGSIVKNLVFISGPGIEPGNSLIEGTPEDLPATILALMGLDTPAFFDGVSLIDRDQLLSMEICM